MPVMGRQIKIPLGGAGLRCDFCNQIIPGGRVAYQVNEGKAQGVFHGPRCYAAALEKYKAMEKEVGIKGENDPS